MYNEWMFIVHPNELSCFSVKHLLFWIKKIFYAILYVLVSDIFLTVPGLIYKSNSKLQVFSNRKFWVLRFAISCSFLTKFPQTKFLVQVQQEKCLYLSKFSRSRGWHSRTKRTYKLHLNMRYIDSGGKNISCVVLCFVYAI